MFPDPDPQHVAACGLVLPPSIRAHYGEAFAGHLDLGFARDEVPLGLHLVAQQRITRYHPHENVITRVLLLTRWDGSGPVTRQGVPLQGPVDGDKADLALTNAPDMLAVAQTIIDVAATGVPLGPPLLSAVGTALADQHGVWGTVAQMLFIPEEMSTDDDLPDGRKVWAGYTEPYPGAWPRAAVTLAHAGDLSALWPYLGQEQS